MSLLQSLRLTLLERWMLASSRSPLPQHLQTGERGELAALFYLRRLGFVIVARRWRTPKQRGDIDLIAWESDTLCFIEVKTRGSHEVASPESSVDRDKRKILRRMASQYVKGVDPQAANTRFDVVSVYLQEDVREFMLFRGAFDW